MKNQLLITLLIIFSVTTLMTACTKGDPGMSGLDGLNGLPGPPGNVVNVSDTFSIPNAAYTDGYWAIETGTGSLALPARVATKEVFYLTEKIFKTGTVLVYIKTPTNVGQPATQYTLLPYSIRSLNVGYLIRISCAFEAGKLSIYYYYEQTDSRAPVPNISTAVLPTYSFRYVIIPGAEGFRSIAPPIDYADYEAVKKYYHLPD
jgi:hypothetical protein